VDELDVLEVEQAMTQQRPVDEKRLAISEVRDVYDILKKTRLGP